MKRIILLTVALLLGIQPCGAAPAKKKSAPPGAGLPEQVYRRNGIYSLLEAAAAGKLDVMQARIDEGCNVNQQDEQGNTALHLAARAGHARAVQLLLESGASKTILNKEGKGPEPMPRKK